MRSSCKSFSKFWFFLIASLSYGFTLYSSISKYVNIKEIITSFKHGDEWEDFPLSLYLNFIILSIVFFLFSIFFTIRDNGHWANDGIIINSHFVKDRHTKTAPNESSYSPQFYLPFNMLIYFISAFMLWLPNSWLNGEIIRNGAARGNDLWSMELGFLFPYGQQFNLKINSKSSDLHHLLPAWKKFQDIVYNYYPNDKSISGTILMSIQPLALGGLGQLPQTESQVEIANKAKNSIIDAHSELNNINPKISYELINVLIAALFILLRLPSVFCLASRMFTILSTVILSFSLIQLVFETILFSLLLKLTVCFSKIGLYKLQNLPLDSLQIINFSISLSPLAIFILAMINFIFLVMTIITFYEYGVKEFYRRMDQKFDFITHPNYLTINQGNEIYETGYMKVIKNLKYSNKLKILYEKKLVQAVGLIIAVLKVTIEIPLLVECVKLYIKKSASQILFTIIFSLLMNLLWIFLWFCFLIKNSINFKIKHSTIINNVANFNNVTNTLSRQHNNNDLYYRRNSIHLVSPSDYDHVNACHAQKKQSDFNLYSCINHNLDKEQLGQQGQMTKSYNFFDTSTLNNHNRSGDNGYQKSIIVKSKSNYNCTSNYDIDRLCHLKLESNESDDSHVSSNVQSNDSGFINTSLINQNQNTSFCYNDFIGNVQFLDRKMVGDDISRPNTNNYGDIYNCQSDQTCDHSTVPKMPLILDPIPISGILNDNIVDLERICSQV